MQAKGAPDDRHRLFSGMVSMLRYDGFGVSGRHSMRGQFSCGAKEEGAGGTKPVTKRPVMPGVLL
ncbi:hypothetical protein KCP74_15865 [Salmonella enterica subsp. enterica]|nr:hypothetical protein KCP74_15865 [Salmonella enterica subsp. enterica]